jgi:hypothetical protein
MPNINGSTNGWGPTRPVKDKIKLKIVSDGTSSGTHVVDRETGERLESVMAIEWRISAGNYAEANYAEAILTLRNIPVELVAIRSVGKIDKTISRIHKRRIELEK